MRKICHVPEIQEDDAVCQDDEYLVFCTVDRIRHLQKVYCMQGPDARDEGGYTQSIIVGLVQYGKALDTLKAPMTLAVQTFISP